MAYLSSDDEKVTQLSKQLKPEAKAFIDLCNDSDVETLGKILLKKVGKPTTPKSLSAVKNSPPPCPLFILHGSTDNVIPPSQLATLEKWAQGNTKVYALNSPLISHVELGSDNTDNIEYWKIIRFWTELLGI